MYCRRVWISSASSNPRCSAPKAYAMSSIFGMLPSVEFSRDVLMTGMPASLSIATRSASVNLDTMANSGSSATTSSGSNPMTGMSVIWSVMFDIWGSE